MTVQPIRSEPTPRIPFFEGRQVDAVNIRLSGLSSVDDIQDRVVSVDDTVHLTGEYRVVSVRHYVDDKTGNLVREQILKPVAVMITPWDPSDPKDDGVVRAVR